MKVATDFPQCNNNYFNLALDRLRGKGGITGGLANQSLVWFDGKEVFTIHSIDFVYCSPFPGGFTYFKGCSSGETYCHASLSSPLITSRAGWKCLQFWYYIWGGQLKVRLVSNEKTSRTVGLFYSAYPWRLGLVNLSADFPYEVSTIKKSLSCSLL